VVVALLVVSVASLGSAIAVASSRSGKGNSPQSGALSLRAGTPVASSDVNSDYAAALESTGATAQLALLGEEGDHSYYRASTVDGRTCFAIGDGTHLLNSGCVYSSDQMPTALLDSARVTMSPQGDVLHLVGDEGIAADQVATVAIERSDGSFVTTPVIENVYRFADAAILSDAVAIVALDKSGAVLERKSLL
jgi:hypothetical protein